jgi:hypothetical protein
MQSSHSIARLFAAAPLLGLLLPLLRPARS